MWLTLSGSIPEQSYLGPLCFLLMSNNLKLTLSVSKFVDDTTLTELVVKSAEPSCKMQRTCNKLVQWSEENKLNINARKTKGLIFCQQCNRHLAPVNIQAEMVERVTKLKLLGVIVHQLLKWNDHILSVKRKANSRRYFLKRLKRVELQTDNLVLFFKSIILPVLEYASSVQHSGLTQDQSSVVEPVQKRVM